MTMPSRRKQVAPTRALQQSVSVGAEAVASFEFSKNPTCTNGKEFGSIALKRCSSGECSDITILDIWPESPTDDSFFLAEINILETEDEIKSCIISESRTSIGSSSDTEIPPTSVHIRVQSSQNFISTQRDELSAKDTKVSLLVIDPYNVQKEKLFQDIKDFQQFKSSSLASEGQFKVLHCGTFDGDNKAVTALIYLIQRKLISLSASLPLAVDSNKQSGNPRLQVHLLSLVTSDSPTNPNDTVHRLPHKQMMTLMAWLRPEVSARTVSNFLHRKEDNDTKGSNMHEVEADQQGRDGDPASDISSLYFAIKRTGKEPELKGEFPELLPTLRPYQRRAAHWMLHQEKRQWERPPQPEQALDYAEGQLDRTAATEADGHPLWMPIDSVEGRTRIFYNPYSGRFSRKQFPPPKLVRGGILADEMGLGKTMELLACILAHRKGRTTSLQPTYVSKTTPGYQSAAQLCQGVEGASRGAPSECAWSLSDGLQGGCLRVQCSLCQAWQVVKSTNGITSSKKSTSSGCMRQLSGEMEFASNSACSAGDTSLTDLVCTDATAGCLKDDTSTGHGITEEPGDELRTNPSVPTGATVKVQVSGSDSQSDDVPRLEALPTPGCTRKRSVRGRGAFIGMKSDGTGDNGGEEAEYVCSICSGKQGDKQTYDCVATLVVCPTPILRQWQQEIARHVRPGTLRVIVYEGVQLGSSIVLDSDAFQSRRTACGKAARAQGDSCVTDRLAVDELAQADIVLTTYDVLRSDLFHDPCQTSIERSMRFEKRYRVVPTPLTRLRWWRVCLDEAQLVEGSATRAADMAQRLHALHRWCISGTPIQRSLEDLHGLLRFLHAEPFCQHHWWTHALLRPYQEGVPGAKDRMYAYLQSLMWRQSKEDVAHELELPPQSEVLTNLRFSEVEAFFYRRQHADCANKAREVLARHARAADRAADRARARAEREAVRAGRVSVGSLLASEDSAENVEGLKAEMLLEDEPAAHEEAWDSSSRGAMAQKSGGPLRVGAPSWRGDEGTGVLPGRSGEALTGDEAKAVGQPLLRLRQACCHPQVGSAGLRSLQANKPMPMEDILQLLIGKACVEAEEAQRLLVSALNGLAGLALIKDDKVAAAAMYREALATMEENSKEFRADPLQKLHTLHNLGELLHGPPEPAHGGSLVNGQGQLGKPAGASFRAVAGLAAGVDTPPAAVAGLARTLRDDQLPQQSAEIREHYMAPFHAKLAAAQHSFDAAHNQVEKVLQQLAQEEGGMLWWLEALSLAEERGENRGEGLADRLRSTLLESDHLYGNHHRNASNIGLRFRTLHGLKLVLHCELGAVVTRRQALLTRLLELKVMVDRPSAADVEQAGHCQVCDSNMDGAPCKHCLAQELFQVYETRLFHLKSTARMNDGVVLADDALLAQQRNFQRNRLAMVAGTLGARPPKSLPGVKPRPVLLQAEDLSSGRQHTATEATVTWSPSETEKLLRILAGSLRSIPGAFGLSSAAKKHLEAFEGMRAEFRLARTLAEAQRNVLYGLDELAMATTRMRLRFPGEEVASEAELLFKIHEEELPGRSVRLSGDKFVAVNELARTRGQLRYLKSVAQKREAEAALKEAATASVTAGAESSGAAPAGGGGGSKEGLQGAGAKGDDREELCPVCQEALGAERVLNPCGHMMCCKCTIKLVERTPLSPGAATGKSGRHIPCPSCRRRVLVGEMAYVDSGRHPELMEIRKVGGELPNDTRAKAPEASVNGEQEAAIQVQGSYGTKMEGVVRRILRLGREDPTVQVLVFSSWQEVLTLLEHALQENGISCARARGRRGLDDALQVFRGQQPVSISKPARGRNLVLPSGSTGNGGQGGVVRALLLPIQHGANGLNLVEAQHVLLVEPLMNPAAEQQAINRVHRIGQKRATFVHRFIVKDTVEEGIYAMNKRRAKATPGGPTSGVGCKRKEEALLTVEEISRLFAVKPEGSRPEEQAPAWHVTQIDSNQSALAGPLNPSRAAAAAAEARLRLAAAGIGSALAQAASSEL